MSLCACVIQQLALNRIQYKYSPVLHKDCHNVHNIYAVVVVKGLSLFLCWGQLLLKALLVD